MKKLIILLAICIFPVMSYADTETVTEETTPVPQTVEQEIWEPEYEIVSRSNFFLDYNIDLYSNSEIEISGMDDIDAVQLNASGKISLALGVEGDGFRIAFAPSYQSEENIELGSVGLELDFLPREPDVVNPYIGVKASYNWLEAVDYDIAERAFGFGITGGFIYNIADALYLKTAITYSVVEFEIEDETIEMSGFSLITGFGFRF